MSLCMAVYQYNHTYLSWPHPHAFPVNIGIEQPQGSVEKTQGLQWSISKLACRVPTSKSLPSFCCSDFPLIHSATLTPPPLHPPSLHLHLDARNSTGKFTRGNHPDVRDKNKKSRVSTVAFKAPLKCWLSTSFNNLTCSISRPSVNFREFQELQMDRKHPAW